MKPLLEKRGTNILSHKQVSCSNKTMKKRTAMSWLCPFLYNVSHCKMIVDIVRRDTSDRVLSVQVEVSGKLSWSCTGAEWTEGAPDSSQALPNLPGQHLLPEEQRLLFDLE